MLGRSHSLREDRRRPAEGLSTYQRLSMIGRRSKENVPPMTGQAAASARAAVKDAGASPLRPLQSRDPNRMSLDAQPSPKPAVYPPQAPQALWPPRPPTLQRAATTASAAHTWRPASKHESSSRSVATREQPVHEAQDGGVRPAPKIPATGGASVFRSKSVRLYFEPPKPLSRQPSLAAGRTHKLDGPPVSYTLTGDDLDAVLRKGLEAVKRRQAQVGSEWATPRRGVPHRGTHARPLGDQPLQQLACSSYSHAVPVCQSINAERRPEVRHAYHHYAPHMLESRSAEIYVVR
ncbi:hypothetical protein MCAP1_001580 [Malassezia caprae]|uniref:Uncharacterized protein n=1 Tax=Malassezia caprae TaxID=1381934 RepID=A0AAF0E5Z5_9BASI|nr:hypothetical protein MCAP1_001580 [Malassezia caprae]